MAPRWPATSEVAEAVARAAWAWNTSAIVWTDDCRDARDSDGRARSALLRLQCGRDDAGNRTDPGLASKTWYKGAP